MVPLPATVLVVKNPSASAGHIRDTGSTPGSRSPGGQHGNPLRYSGLENPKDREAWRATVHGVVKIWTRLKQLSMHAPILRLGFPGDSDDKESACNAGDPGLIPGWKRNPGEGNGYPLQYSCLENSMN